MSKHRRPRSGPASENPWAAMARELAANPDSPASLRIMSAVNASVRPRAEAVAQLIDALADQLESPGANADAAVTAARAHWEAVCDVAASDEDLRSMRAEAVERLERRKRQPPKLESIVADVHGRLDAGYALGVSLEGLRGTWHRLWAALSLSKTFDEGDDAFIGVIRAQFEEALGRTLTREEWSALDAHAANHAATVMKRMQGDTPA